MFDDKPVTSLTWAGVIFVIFMAITVITAFLLYPIVCDVFDTFENTNFGDAEDEKDTFLPGIREACTAMFAIFIAIPVSWFIGWVFSREVDVGYIRRY